MKKIYKSLLTLGCFALATFSSSAAYYVYCTDAGNAKYGNIWGWQTGAGEGRMFHAFAVNQVRGYWLENNADNIIFTSATSTDGFNDDTKGGEFNNVVDLTVYAGSSSGLQDKGQIKIRANFDGSWHNYPLTKYDGNLYRTASITLTVENSEFTVVSDPGDGESVGFGASNGVLTNDGDKTQLGGWTNSNGKVALPVGTTFVLSFDALTGYVMLVCDEIEQEDPLAAEFNMDNIAYARPDFGGDPEPFRTLTSNLTTSGQLGNDYWQKYRNNIDKCRMLLAVNQKENVSADDLTNQWIKYEDRDPSKETAFFYYNSDDIIEPGDERYDIIMNDPVYGPKMAKRNEWTLSRNHTDIHNCRNFNNAWYRGYMIAENVGLEDIRQQHYDFDLTTKDTKAGAGRKNIRMSMMGNNDNRVARTFFMQDNTSGIEDILDQEMGEFVHEEYDGTEQFFNLQGQQVLNPVAGQVYIVKRGHEATKEVYNPMK